MIGKIKFEVRGDLDCPDRMRTGNRFLGFEKGLDVCMYTIVTRREESERRSPDDNDSIKQRNMNWTLRDLDEVW